MPYPAENLSLEYRVLGDLAREYSRSSEIMERYFGQNCLKRPGFKIQTLGMACILFGVDQKRLLQEVEKIQRW
jgi:hypothetical protein